MNLNYHLNQVHLINYHLNQSVKYLDLKMQVWKAHSRVKCLWRQKSDWSSGGRWNVANHRRQWCELLPSSVLILNRKHGLSSNVDSKLTKPTLINQRGIILFWFDIVFSRYCWSSFMNSRIKVERMVILNLFIDYHYKSIVSTIRAKHVLTLHLSTASWRKLTTGSCCKNAPTHVM